MKKMMMVATVPSMIGCFNMSNIRILLKMEYEVHIACNFNERSIWPKETVKEFIEQIREMGIFYHQVDFSRSPRNIKKIKKSFKQISQLMEKENFDFVHCHTPMASFISRIVCNKYGIKVMYTAHGFHFYKGASKKNWLLFYPIEWLLSWITDVLITINHEDYKRAKRMFHAKRTVYIPGIGVDMKKFNQGLIDPKKKRKELGIDSDAILLLSVGELIPRKNHEIVIKALTQFDNPKITYLIAGKGIMEEKLKALVRRLNLERQVYFLGFRTDVAELYQIADIFIFPSHQEGLPVALMEAIACNMPVICSNIRGNKDLVIDRRFLFNQNSEEDVVRSLRRILAPRNKMMTSTKNAIKKNRENLKKYELSVVETLMENEYKLIEK